MAYRKTERAAAAERERRRQLLESTAGLVARGGFAAATVKAIATECEVSVGLVYSYFDGRPALLAEFFRTAAAHELNVVRAAVAAAGPAAADKVDALVTAFASRALRGRQLAWSLLFEPSGPRIEAERLEFRSAYIELGHRILDEGVASGELPAYHPETTAAALMGAIAEALIGRLTPGPARTGLSDEETVAEIRRFCRRAIGAPGTAAETGGRP